mgnify:CR=1 FL=1
MKKRLIPIVLFLSLVGLGGLSLVSIHNLQGNARVINYTGVVRGATQRLVKEELKGRADDALIARLDGSYGGTGHRCGGRTASSV